MESRFGYDFGRVRIHADGAAVASARAVNALAYTVGNHVVLGAGAFPIASTESHRLLAHELTHVIQQDHVSGEASDAEWSLSHPLDREEQQADRLASMVMGREAHVSDALSRLGPVRDNGLASVARQTAATPPRTRIQCINANLSNAGIPWAVIGIAGSVCGLLGAIAGLATGPAAPAASPSAAAVAAAYCIAGVAGVSVGMVLGVITRCIQDPSVEWVFAQNESPNAPATPTAVASTAAAPASTGATGETAAA
jgi:hypothetical protein